jgi:hypothetical protein
MNSACDLLLGKTYQEFWYRGEKYANEGRVVIKKYDEKEVVAEVKGTEPYLVTLKFLGGGISRRCNCPYSKDASSRRASCKHMIAVAILWDEARGIKRPTKEEIESYTISPPLVTRSQIDKLYRDPLNADLEILRIAADESGHWSRPHARLPNLPNFITDEKTPLTNEEVKKAFSQIKSWSNRRHYDPYFCAGEMVAAFCEVARIIKKRLLNTPPVIAAQILREAQKFHYIIIMQLIDDSDGLHVFTEAHLDDIYQKLKEVQISEKEKNIFGEKLREFDSHRDDY